VAVPAQFFLGICVAPTPCNQRAKNRLSAYCDERPRHPESMEGIELPQHRATPYSKLATLVLLISSDGESFAMRTAVSGHVRSDHRPLQIWVQNWVQLTANIPH